MWYKNRIYNQGFTLGELLVAIAVISVLSTIVLVSSAGSREKALNSKRVSLVEQYITAFEMYRQDNGSYPDASTNTYCLGDEPDGSCGLGNEDVSENGPFNNTIKPYIVGLPTLPDLNLINPVDSGDTSWDGATYRCVTSSNCKQYEIQWYMQGPNMQLCGQGSAISSISDDTNCLYTSMRFD